MGKIQQRKVVALTSAKFWPWEKTCSVLYWIFFDIGPELLITQQRKKVG